MDIPLILTDGQQVALGVTIFDQARPTPNQYNSIAEYPEGFSTTWETSDPNVAELHVRADGLNVDVLTPTPGNAVVTVTTTGLPPDTFSITVQRSVPGSQNPTAGAPEDEGSVPDDGSGSIEARSSANRSGNARGASRGGSSVNRSGAIDASDKDGFKS